MVAKWRHGLSLLTSKIQFTYWSYLAIEYLKALD